MKIILQKYIAKSGYCSRRKAEEMIRSGKVFVNSENAELGQRVDDGDDVRVGATKIEAITEKIYIKLNKPRGYVCTNRDFDAEQNVFELIDREYDYLHVVGRLDKNSHGLVILTNDGDFTAKMTHPRYEHEKEYIVRIKDEKLATCQADRNIETREIVKELKKGVNIGDGDGVVRAKSVEQLSDKIFKIILTQGKKRQIRRMFEALGYRVSDLERVRIADIVLGDLKVREWEMFQLRMKN